MKEVPTIAIGDLESVGQASLQTGPFGTQLKASDYVSDGIPVINVRNIGFGKVRKADLEFLAEGKAEKLHQHRLVAGDIVFGRKGAVERHALIDATTDGWIQGSDCLRVRVNTDRVCEKYLSYYLRTSAHQDWMQALCSFGATMASLNQDIVRRIRFPAPPLKTQRRIAAILSAYDDLIENNRRRIALLEKMAEEIYREWFVRLRFPGHEQAKFEKGVPVGWLSKKFGEFCKLKRGYDLPDDQVVPGPFPVVAATAVKTFHNQFKAEPPLITTGRSGSLGGVLITYQRAWPLNTTLYVQDCYGNSAFLIYYTLKFMGLESFNAGAGVPTLNRNHLNGIPMNVPPRAIQRAFDEQIAPIHRQIESLKASTDLATRSRDALLPRLISGKLPVDALDIRFPSSMQLE